MLIRTFVGMLFLCNLLVSPAQADIAAAVTLPNEIRVSNEGEADYIFKLPEGDLNDPDIILVRGQSYTIIAEFPGFHPFYVRNQSDDADTAGVVGQGVAAPGRMTINVTDTTPDSLYYICGFHEDMRGNIYVIDPPAANNRRVPLPVLGLAAIALGLLGVGLRKSA